VRESNIQIGGEFFRNRTALKKRLQTLVGFADRTSGVRPRFFTSEFLGQALVDRHFRFTGLDYVPVCFGFVSNDLVFHFHNTALSNLYSTKPGFSLSVDLRDIGWVPFSYRDIVAPKTEFDQSLFTKVCRDRWMTHWRDKKCGNMCVDCHALDNLEVDHIEPTHAEVRNACWELLNSSFPDLKEIWWKHKKAVSQTRNNYWPPDHPVTQLYDYLTEGGEYQTVCKDCHRQHTKNRKRVGRP